MSVKNKKALLRIAISSILLISGFFFDTHKLIVFSIPFIVVGYDVIWSAIRNIIHGRVFDEKFLMTIATIGAFVIGEYPEAVAVMLFYQIGELFQSIAVGKSRKSITDLINIEPESATVIRDNVEIELLPEEVNLGETVLIKPGEKIPLDGVIIKGSTSVNTSALTGESIPADKTVGDSVISGCINLSGAIYITAASTYENSTVAKMLELVENSSQKKAKIENFISRFARIYTPFVVICALLLALVPPLLFSGNWMDWINRAFVFLVVSCPCALVVSVPLSFFASIGLASRKGILIKGANYIDALSRVDTVALDKTGTITKGTFVVDAIHPSVVSAEELLDIAFAAESHSNHPIAESIVLAHKNKISKRDIQKLTDMPGMGICVEIDNKTYYVGNGKMMDYVGSDWHPCHLCGTVVHVSEGSTYLGHIVINDEIKTNSCKAILELKQIGIKNTIMLTGDNKKVADFVAERVRVDSVMSDLLPEQKVSAVENLIKSNAKVCYVGDGINDAPVLSLADVGVAMGVMGSDAAIESADIVIMDDNLTKLSTAIKISRKTMHIAHQNIWFSLIVKGAILVLGALGLTNMWIAIFGDVGVMVLAILNSLRCMINKK